LPPRSACRRCPPSSPRRLDPDWADPPAEGEKIISDLPTGLGELVVIDGAGHYPHAQTPDQVLALALPFLANTLANA
jgi:pimeloyl-ACP methyl ester carboxylesterase